MAETCDSVAETQRQTRVSISEYITLFHVSVFDPWSLVRKYMKPGHLQGYRIAFSGKNCDHCCAYQLICIMTINTYTTSARAEMTR